MSKARQILLEKARSYREYQDELDEVKYANRKDELQRLRLARKDEKTIQYLRDVIAKARGKK